jgi:GTPase
MTNNPEQMQHCGTVAIIGPTNAGKSTLLNRLIGSKIAIVSHKVQTTRNRIAGIFTEDATQIVFIDTPGIFTPSKRFEKAMVRTAWDVAFSTDFILLVVDARIPLPNDIVTPIIERFQKSEKRLMVALNKIDAVERSKLLAQAQYFQDSGIVQELFMISARKGDGVDTLKKYFHTHMPAQPWMYPEDQLADLPMKMLAAEITREQIFNMLHQEIPYGIAVQTELWEPLPNRSVKVMQTLIVSRDNHKAIVLGARGQMIKAIGQRAREELQKILGQPVHLYLHVLVDEKWQDRPAYYQELGLPFKV